MAVAHDNATYSDTTASSSHSFSHTTTGANLCLLVAVHTFNNTASPPTVTACTYNSVSMTEVGTRIYGVAGFERITLFRLAGPATGSNTVSVTCSGTSDEIVCIAQSSTGVDQADPIRASVSEADTGTTTHEVSVSSAVGDLVVDFLAWYNSTMTVDGSQSSRINQANGAALQSIACSTEAGAAGSVAMTWTSSVSENSGHWAVSLREASGGGQAKRILLMGVG